MGDLGREPTARLVGLLADAAGISVTQFSVRLLASGDLTNSTWMIQADGSRYVLREYRWRHQGPDDLDRPEKEAWLAELVRSRGVPAPRQLARMRFDGTVAVLREYLPGRPLGDVPTTCASAWRSAGETLARVHGIRISADGRAGVIAGREVRPFAEGSWGQWQLANAVAHSRKVAGRGGYNVDPDRVRSIYERAVPLLDKRPVRLIHNDPHPWNILVGGSGELWGCTGLLDWEFAWAADPAWDVARLDAFRLKDIGATPPAFDSGYRSARDPVVSQLYEFAIMLWMSNQDAAGDQLLRPTYRRVHEYLSDADAVLARFERDVA